MAYEPPTPRCPMCGESDCVEELARYTAKTRIKHSCTRCDVGFVGTIDEWMTNRDARLARRAELGLDERSLAESGLDDGGALA